MTENRKANHYEPSEPAGWMIEHCRSGSSSTCRWGPFATKEEGVAWCNEHQVDGLLVPLYLTVDWNRRG